MSGNLPTNIAVSALLSAAVLLFVNTQFREAHGLCASDGSVTSAAGVLPFVSTLMGGIKTPTLMNFRSAERALIVQQALYDSGPSSGLGKMGQAFAIYLLIVFAEVATMLSAAVNGGFEESSILLAIGCQGAAHFMCFALVRQHKNENYEV